MRRLTLSLFVSLVASSLAAGDRQPVPHTYGTQTSILPISSSAFRPASHSVQFSSATTLLFSPNGGSFSADVALPNGAEVHAFEIEGCDSHDLMEVAMQLERFSLGTSSELGAVSSGIAEMPGCASWRFDFVEPVAINNEVDFYRLVVSPGTTTDAGFIGARVFYKLSVSDAPATATFEDIPTDHPLNKFVEALVSAGITGGCGNSPQTGEPLFCPNSPLTRGQMAVFLAVALGLQHP